MLYYILNIFIVGCYVAFVIFCAKKYRIHFEGKLEKDISSRQQILKKSQEKKEARYQEKMALEEEAIKIFMLYEVTREITKSINEKEAFEVFKKKLEQHLKFSSCHFFGPEIEDIKILKPSEDAYVFALQEKKKLLGYLVFQGLEEQEKEKVMILGNQFALVLRRVFLYQEIERVAITDSLTEVHTRRYFEERFEEEMKRSKVRNIKLSFLMMDVDLFKEINDTNGHLTGDQVLREIGRIIKENIREIDIPARYGGEEFCIVLPDTDYLGAQYVAERIRKAVQETTMKVYDTTINVTISIGVSNFPKDSDHSNDLMDKADFALYRAKKYGRNKVLCFAELSPDKE